MARQLNVGRDRRIPPICRGRRGAATPPYKAAPDSLRRCARELSRRHNPGWASSLAHAMVNFFVAAAPEMSDDRLATRFLPCAKPRISPLGPAVWPAGWRPLAAW